MTQTTPHQTVLIKAHKQSAKARWTDHFKLQLRSHGFTILSQETFENSVFDNLIDMRKIVVHEFRFHPERKFRLDFAIPEIKVGIEIEGGIWMRGGGGHSHPTGIERDIEKSNLLALADYRLLRFTEKEIRAGTSIQMTAAIAT